MKTFNGKFISILGFLLFTAFTVYQRAEEKPVEVLIEPQEVIFPEIEIEAENLNFGVKLYGHEAFLGELGFMESSNDYKAVNRLGYLGRYQFGRATLNNLNIKVTNREFLSNPELQEYAMQKLLEANYKSLKRYINKYDGQVVHGVLVTKSGVLAAAHLGGAGNVKKWFRKGEVFSDANGTKITYYMERFSGYRLNV